MNQTTTTTNSSTVSAEAISARAYELWEKEGRIDGKDQHYWFQAEQELRGASSRSDSSTKAPARNSDVAPLKGTRAGAAVENAAARGNATSSPASTTSGASSSKPAGKRASANPFPGKKPTPAL